METKVRIQISNFSLDIEMFLEGAELDADDQE